MNKTDDQILDYHEDWLGMEITRFDKSGYDSLKKDTCHLWILYYIVEKGS